MYVLHITKTQLHRIIAQFSAYKRVLYAQPFVVVHTVPAYIFDRYPT